MVSITDKKRNNELVQIKNKKQLQSYESDKQVFKSLKRTSELQAPNMILEGHKQKVLTVQFSPCGRYLATGSQDRQILFWYTSEDCKNYGMIDTGAPVLDLVWNRDSSNVYSCSSDASLSCWDVETGERIKKFRGHKAVVNSLSVSRRGNEMVASVSDDTTLKVWDRNGVVKQFKCEFPLLSVAFSHDAGIVFCSGVDSHIYVRVFNKAYDLRSDSVLYTLKGHEDIVTGLKTSPNGDLLLSNSMDNTGILELTSSHLGYPTVFDQFD
jgi:Prp8 binding protein